jgi:hypothetical protein
VLVGLAVIFEMSQGDFPIEIRGDGVRCANISRGSPLSYAVEVSSQITLCLCKRLTFEVYPIGSIPPRTEHTENLTCVYMSQPPFDALSYL